MYHVSARGVDERMINIHYNDGDGDDDDVRTRAEQRYKKVIYYRYYYYHCQGHSTEEDTVQFGC